jgi:hypothetical protein
MRATASFFRCCRVVWRDFPTRPSCSVLLRSFSMKNTRAIDADETDIISIAPIYGRNLREPTPPRTMTGCQLT